MHGAPTGESITSQTGDWNKGVQRIDLDKLMINREISREKSQDDKKINEHRKQSEE